MASLVDAAQMTMNVHVRDDRRRVAIVYQPKVREAHDLARELKDLFESHGAEPILQDAWNWEPTKYGRDDLDWAVTLGGDGTMLRTARNTAPLGIPIIGVNFGRLAFLAELEPNEAPIQLLRLLGGEGRVEERTMLRAGAQTRHGAAGPSDGLNDVFIGRGRLAHAVRLEVAVNGAPVVRFVADGIVAATPTGSTAYSLSAGGPIIAPDLDVIVLTPVVSHPSTVRPLVVPGESVVDVRVLCLEEAVLTVDGQVHVTLEDGDTVQMARSPHRTRFLRLEPPDGYYESLMKRLRR